MFRGSGGKDAAKRVGDTVSGFSSNLSRQIRDNPIPSLLIGAGLAWLAFAGDEKEASRRRIRRYPGDDLWDETFDEDGFVEYDEYAGDLAQADPLHTMSPSDGLYSPEAEGYAGGDIDVFNQSGDKEQGKTQVGSSIGKTLSSAGETISDAASATTQAVGNAASTVGSAVSSAGKSVSRTAKKGYRGTRRELKSAYSGAARSGRRMRKNSRQAYDAGAAQLQDWYDASAEAVARAHDDYPLAVGLGCLALGALTGLAISRKGTASKAVERRAAEGCEGNERYGLCGE